MSDVAAAHQTRLITPAAAAADEAAPQNVEGALDKIATYIPSEVIGTYVAITGIFDADSDAGKWVIFVLALLLIPLLTLFGNAEAAKKGLTPPTGRATLLTILIAGVAFCAWAAALPANPLLAFTEQATRIGGAAVIVLAIVLPKAAALLDIAPRTS